MLDPRIYRAALLPVLLAFLVVAFSLEDRSRPIGTTLPPDAFRETTPHQTLETLADRYPDRRAGSEGDDRLAADVADRMRRIFRDSGVVREERFEGHTLDGGRDLVNVIASRPGAPGAQIVVVAHRDAAERGSRAELSGTAALLELANVAADGRFRRTITLISTSGGSGGVAGAIKAAEDLDRPVTAVLVLGDLASMKLRKPWVVPWVDAAGVAALQLRRTVEQAVRIEVEQDPGGPRAITQLVRQAFAVAPGEQGALGAAGLPAVTLSASGERGPAPGAATSARRLTKFGRAALRAIVALDNGPTIGTAPETYVVTKRKVLPGWAIRLLGGALLLPVWLSTIDGYARARRRRGGAGRWLGWVLALALPFALACALAVLLALTGLVEEAAHAPLPTRAGEIDGAAIAALGVLALALALAFLVVRPLALRVAGPGQDDKPVGAGPAAAVAIAMSLLTLVTWALNPVAALLLVPAAHMWLFAVAPETHVGRVGRIALVVGGLVLPAAAALTLAGTLGLSPLTGAWLTILAIAGGAIGPMTWLAWCLLAGCTLAALSVARHPPEREQLEPVEVTSRGPLTYAGPGSLGGTESAIRR